MVTGSRDPRWIALVEALVRKPCSSFPPGRYAYLVYSIGRLAATTGKAGVRSPLPVLEPLLEHDASAVVLEADSLPELLLRMYRSEEFDPTEERHGYLDDHEAFLEELAADDPLRGVDFDLAAAAQVLSEHGQLIHDYTDLHYCHGAVEARPGSMFVVGWDAVPPGQDLGWCILGWPRG